MNSVKMKYNLAMDAQELQDLCEKGQAALTQTDYITAHRLLTTAEAAAWNQRDFDTLARLYLPLQETRRQLRLHAGEGVVCLDLLASAPQDHLSGDQIVAAIPHGQLLVAGWGTIQPAARVRQLAREKGLFLETFLAAVYPVGAQRVVVIVPFETSPLPPATPRSTVDQLKTQLPPNCLILSQSELPTGRRAGSMQTLSQVSTLWERLHAPFMRAADNTADLLQRVQAYRQTIVVDSACELAHQKLGDVAHQLEKIKA
ncbi:MAG: hypothetical protein IT448_05430 [Phycisphaerales bacterium]|nr:hypothetical protein [Phycisphaerales bacterium]